MEKIPHPYLEQRFPWKHLHIRGENANQRLPEALKSETPPHTWRKSHIVKNGTNLSRNTSTYVEKICSANCFCTLLGKHLHIRGENFRAYNLIYNEWETPPHTWRKSYLNFNYISNPGNTSTYVEKIITKSSNSSLKRNTSTYVEKITVLCQGRISFRKHLHIRGENRPAL